MSKSNTTALIIDKNRAEDEIFYDLERAELDFNDKHEHLKSFFISGKSLQTLKRTAEKLTDKLLSDKNKNIKYCTFGEVPPRERERIDNVSIILQ